MTRQQRTAQVFSLISDQPWAIELTEIKRICRMAPPTVHAVCRDLAAEGRIRLLEDPREEPPIVFAQVAA